MINHRKKFIFIHCQKCGGESIEKALSEKVNRGYNGDPFEGSPDKHFSSYLYFNKYGKKIWDDCFTFSMIRNPWDRLISWISYRSKRMKIDRKINKDLIIKEINTIYGYNEPTYDKMLDHKEIKNIDFIGRFENLQEDFDYICKKIGVVQKKLPHCNKSNHDHYRDYYDDETKEIVNKLHKIDIEKYGYEF